LLTRLLLSTILRDARALDTEGRARLAKLVEDRSPLGLEPAALSVLEPLLGKSESREVHEHAPRALEAFLELRRDRAERRRARLSPDPIRGLVQDRGPLVLVLRGAVRLDERERLARR
jgi:hypothetical protein